MVSVNRSFLNYLSGAQVPRCLMPMNFLFGEADVSAILEEAFALIDACDDSSTSSSSGSDSSGSTTSPNDSVKIKPSPVAPSSEPKQAPKPKKKRVRRPETSSTAFQRRKKAELLALRDEAANLEAQLEKLKRPSEIPWGTRLDMAVNGSRDTSSTGILAEPESAVLMPADRKIGAAPGSEQAIRQYRLRLLSEKTNRKLKAVLANQVKVNDGLRGLLQKRSVLYGEDFVFANRPQPFVLDESLPVMTQLEMMVDRIYLSCDFDRQVQKPASMDNTVHVEYDEQRGKTIEFRSTTPMACSIKHARDFIWNDFRSRRTQGSGPNTLERKFVMTVQTNAGALRFNRLHSLRRFEENDRFVVVCTDIMVMPAKGLRFRSEGWMVVTRSTTDPLRSCVARNFKTLFVDCEHGGPARPEDREFAQGIALDTLSGSYKAHVDSQQETLVEEAARVGMDSVSMIV
ncbi:hypothetical protein BBJ28_00002936 [Nothophytophthora sp. Chile5]|nr:hypothetical protein BBJ28_00002936 [Nothophytophthora sp. Chile5]